MWSCVGIVVCLPWCVHMLISSYVVDVFFLLLTMNANASLTSSYAVKFVGLTCCVKMLLTGCVRVILAEFVRTEQQNITLFSQCYTSNRDGAIYNYTVIHDNTWYCWPVVFIMLLSDCVYKLCCWLVVFVYFWLQ